MVFSTTTKQPGFIRLHLSTRADSGSVYVYPRFHPCNPAELGVAPEAGRTWQGFDMNIVMLIYPGHSELLFYLAADIWAAVCRRMALDDKK